MHALASADIVPQRTIYDCLPAALATTLGWSYEKARTITGTHTTEGGTFLMPLASALLPERIAGTYVMSRTHPQLPPAAMTSAWGNMLASPAEIRRQIQGHRAIVIVPGRGPRDEVGPEFGHAIAWDGQRAINCGSTGANPEPPREVSLDDVPPWEALILTSIADAPPAPVTVPPDAIASDASLAAIFDRYERVFLGFSGGKDSIALAHMLEPWRDRVTLLWVNTGYMAAHMVEFVRSFGDRFDLVEIASPSLPQVWEASGIPADVAPFRNVLGQDSPRLQPWLSCCLTVRQMPVNDFLRRQGPCCYINGQRADEAGGATLSGLRSNLPPSVEVALPLTDWSAADVFAYVAQHDLKLPP
ncbi:phosphoadenosine phosphosulfate reductase family protein, partial [Methylobacterium sp. WL12]|uniref:phosphoadenosine phosphosulfate reductase domain-containing protein n=1 Tax=Methylobacterium sp. WL12 TaxID=2603890 RepID=UPI0011CB4EBA